MIKELIARLCDKSKGFRAQLFKSLHVLDGFGMNNIARQARKINLACLSLASVWPGIP